MLTVRHRVADVKQSCFRRLSGEIAVEFRFATTDPVGR